MKMKKKTYTTYYAHRRKAIVYFKIHKYTIIESDGKTEDQLQP